MANMRTTIFVTVVLAAACSAKSSRDAMREAPGSRSATVAGARAAGDHATMAQGRPGPAAPRQTARDLVACPTDAIALAARLVPADDADNGEPLERESAKCTAGFFPAPGWVVAFRRGLSYERVVIDAATRRVIARAALDHAAGSAFITIKRLATIDFDGDGTSEILHHYEYDSGGYSEALLEAYQVRGGSLVQVFRTTLGSDNSGAEPEAGREVSYQASYTLTKEPDGTRGIEVKGRMSAGTRSDLPDGAVLGTARFRWSGDRLAPQRR